MTAHFSLETGETINLTKVFLFSRERRAIFPVPSEDFNSFPGKLAMGSDVLVAFSTDNKVYYLMDDAVHEVDYSGSDVYYKMKELKGLKMSAEQANVQTYMTIRNTLRI